MSARFFDRQVYVFANVSVVSKSLLAVNMKIQLRELTFNIELRIVSSTFNNVSLRQDFNTSLLNKMHLRTDITPHSAIAKIIFGWSTAKIIYSNSLL